MHTLFMLTDTSVHHLSPVDIYIYIYVYPIFVEKAMDIPHSPKKLLVLVGVPVNKSIVLCVVFVYCCMFFWPLFIFAIALLICLSPMSLNIASVPFVSLLFFLTSEKTRPE